MYAVLFKHIYIYRPTARNLIERIEQVLEEQDDPFNALDLTDLINQTNVSKQTQPTHRATEQETELQPAAVAMQRTEALKVSYYSLIHI